MEVLEIIRPTQAMNTIDRAYYFLECLLASIVLTVAWCVIKLAEHFLPQDDE
jgi:hypothetical protein